MRNAFVIRLVALAALSAPVAACGASSGDAHPSPTVTVTETAPAPAAKAPAKKAPATKAPAPKTEAPATEPEGEGAISDGTYLVGEDIPAGTYKTKGPGSTDILDSCYFERAKDDSGSLNSILDNDNLTGPGRTTVSKGQVLTLSGGCDWVKVG